MDEKIEKYKKIQKYLRSLLVIPLTLWGYGLSMLIVAHWFTWHFVVGLVLILAIMGVSIFFAIKQNKLEKQKKEEEKNKKISEANEIAELKTALEEVRAKVGEVDTKPNDIEEQKVVAQSEANNQGVKNN